MAGGIWSTQNKVLPGVYIRFQSTSGANLTVGERGTVAICEPMSWGPVGQVMTVEAGADIIMFDNMDNATMAEAVRIVGGRAKTEASGNMSIPRLKEVAATGVDYISVGALTHSVTALDISMNIIQE